MKFILLLNNCVNGTWLLTNPFRNESTNSCPCSTEVWNQNRQTEPQNSFPWKIPLRILFLQSSQVQGSFMIIYYMMEIRKLYVSSTMAGSGLLSQLCFPYISTPLTPKLWCRMRIPDLAPIEHERSPRNKSACSWPHGGIWDRQTSLTPNLTGQSGWKSGSFLGQCFFATALKPKRTQELELG